MTESITVYVVKYRDRDNLVMRYRCPLTNKQVSRSTGTTRRKEAERIAAKWEAELREGRYQRTNRMAWEEFVEYWTDSRGSLLKGRTTFSTYLEAMTLFARLCRPQAVSDLTTPRMTAFAAELRKGGRSEATVAKHLRSMRAIANWAHKQELIAKPPAFDMPAPGGMKGRPITGEEFERMLAATEAVVGPDAAPSWRLLLQGLWWSGLRLGEAIDLRWDS